MRTLVFSAIFAVPILYLFISANKSLEQAKSKPRPASITFTAGTAKDLLAQDDGRCIRAVLRE
jgi:hypothetical protein